MIAPLTEPTIGDGAGCPCQGQLTLDHETRLATEHIQALMADYAEPLLADLAELVALIRARSRGDQTLTAPSTRDEQAWLSHHTEAERRSRTALLRSVQMRLREHALLAAGQPVVSEEPKKKTIEPGQTPGKRGRKPGIDPIMAVDGEVLLLRHASLLGGGRREIKRASVIALMSSGATNGEIARVLPGAFDAGRTKVELPGNDHWFARTNSLDAYASYTVVVRFAEAGNSHPVGEDYPLLYDYRHAHTQRSAEASVGAMFIKARKIAGLPLTIQGDSLRLWYGRKQYEATGDLRAASAATGIDDLNRVAQICEIDLGRGARAA
jgi:hypothetical protein